MPYKDREKNRTYQREWARKNRATQRRYYRELRRKALEKLGGKCIYCGCDNFEALEINHIHGGGAKEMKRRKRSRRQYYYEIINGTRKSDDLELTCRICNAYHYLKEIRNIKGDWIITWVGIVKGIPSSI